MEDRKEGVFKTYWETLKNFTTVLMRILLALCALYSLYSIFSPISFVAYASQKADREKPLSETLKRQH